MSSRIPNNSYVRSQLERLNIIKSNNKINSNTHKILKKHQHIEQLITEHTSFLPNSAGVRERLFYIINDTSTIIKCEMCDTPLVPRKTLPMFGKFCSKKCSRNSPQTIKTLKNTLLKKYGVDNVFKSEKVKQQIKHTMLSRYGNESFTGTEAYKTKTIQTNLKKYGVEWSQQSTEVKAKAKNTIIKKYGVPNFKHTLLIPDSLTKLQDSNWMHQQHYIQKQTLSDISDMLRCNISTVSYHLHQHGLETQRFYHSSGELEVLSFVNTISNGYCTSTIIPPYELDIFIPEYKLAIEYCGLYWHSEQRGKDRHYHKRKHDLCREKGIQLLTIFEDEWRERKQQVMNKIKSLCSIYANTSVYARSTNIVKVSSNAKKMFFNKWHIQGNGPGSINLGLHHNGELVACMSFIHQKHNYCLNRYATACLVPGGFSKLINHFCKNYNWKQIISFADLRWSDGNLYDKTGWTLDKTIPPDYYYSPDGHNRYHKFNYRRKNLKKLLNEFNAELSEVENCNNNGILRIWDCGKKRFVLNNQNIQM